MVSQFEVEINRDTQKPQAFCIAFAAIPLATCVAETVEIRLRFDDSGEVIPDPSVERARERWRDAGYAPHSACGESGCAECNGIGWVWRGRPRPLPIAPWREPVVDVLGELERRAANRRTDAAKA